MSLEFKIAQTVFCLAVFLLGMSMEDSNGLSKEERRGRRVTGAIYAAWAACMAIATWMQ